MGNSNQSSKNTNPLIGGDIGSRDSVYADLLSCLEDLVKIYRSLLEVVRREKEILVESRLDELNENNRSKDTLLVRIRSLENSRTKLARDLAVLT
ncbi:MAG: flagellar export chaperone FlgN, partial [Bdellovibrionales bacterium]|nr:flagellar export chaperone FlgN [Bdellovibrionales bacterium]